MKEMRLSLIGAGEFGNFASESFVDRKQFVLKVKANYIRESI